MGFPYKNLVEQNVIFDKDPTADEKFNVFEAYIEALDVSAIVLYGAVVGGIAASAADQIALGVEDGGAAGAGTVSICTNEGGTEVWTDLTPRQVVMSTTVDDVDKGDWINGVYDEAGTVAPAGFSLHLQGTYGIPGGIT